MKITGVSDSRLQLGDHKSSFAWRIFQRRLCTLSPNLWSDSFLLSAQCLWL